MFLKTLVEQIVLWAESLRRTWLIVLAVLVTCWGLGVLLAPDVNAFMNSPEWQVRPFYLAMHVVALNVLVRVCKDNFNTGATLLERQPGIPPPKIGRVPTIWEYLVAAVIAAPLAALDFREIYSVQYRTFSGDGVVRGIDHLMAWIWGAEWFLTAVMWCVLVGFLIRNARAIQRAHTSTIEFVVEEMKGLMAGAGSAYRPFLHMTVEAATVLVVLRSVTVGYIWYTGGSPAEYISLMITMTLLLYCFLATFLLLRKKINRVVHDAGLLYQQYAASKLPREGSLQPSQVVDQLRDVFASVGAHELRALAIRLALPAATMLWVLGKMLWMVRH